MIGVLAFVVLAVVALAVSDPLYNSLTGGTSVGDVNDLIDANLAKGAMAGDVAAFLDSNRIEHDAVGRADDCPYAIFPGLSPMGDTQTICGIMRGAEHGLFCDSDLIIYFAFDQNLRLADHTVIPLSQCVSL